MKSAATDNPIRAARLTAGQARRQARRGKEDGETMRCPQIARSKREWGPSRRGLGRAGLSESAWEIPMDPKKHLVILGHAEGS